MPRPSGTVRARPLRRLETLEAILGRVRAAGDPALQSLVLDLEQRIRLAVRELQELDVDADAGRRS